MESLDKLRTVDVSTLSYDERIDHVVALEAAIAALTGDQQLVLAALHNDPTPDLPKGLRGHGKRWVREEVARALRVSDGIAGSRLSDAAKLVATLPNMLGRVREGDVSFWHARALLDECDGLSDAVVAKVEARVLDRAGRLTCPEFRQSARRTVLTLDPRTAEERHKTAKARRDVWLRALPDGMAQLSSIHTAIDADTLMTIIRAIAKQRQDDADVAAQTVTDAQTAAGAAGADAGGVDAGGADAGGADAGGVDARGVDARGVDARGVDARGDGVDGRVLAGQRRADALRDLILDGADQARVPTRQGKRLTISLMVPLDLALGLRDLPGALVGYGPIPASMCRDAMTQAMADPTSRIRRLVVSPLGEIVDCSTSYRPNQALRDLVTARDQLCRMVGCRRRACDCELDHVVEYDGTNTVKENLHGLCCRHHHLKHEGGWQVERRPDGTTVWTSPTGRQYEKPPDLIPGYQPGDDQPDDDIGADVENDDDVEEQPPPF